MSWSFWINYALALVVVVLMLVGLSFVARGLARGRVLASSQRRLVTVLESTALAPHTAVHVVKVAGRYYLIGGSQGSVTTLAELPSEDLDPWLAQQRQAGQSGALLDALRSLRSRNVP